VFLAIIYNHPCPQLVCNALSFIQQAIMISRSQLHDNPDEAREVYVVKYWLNAEAGDPDVAPQALA